MEQNEKKGRNQTPIEQVMAELMERANKAREIDFNLLVEWCQSGRVPDDEIRAINRAIGAANNSFFRASCFFDGVNPDSQKDEKAEQRAAAAALLADYMATKKAAERFRKAGLESRAAARDAEALSTLHELFGLCAENDILPTDGKRGAESESDKLILAQFDTWRANQ